MRISMGAFIPAAPFRQSRPGHRADRQRVKTLLTDKHYPWGVYASTGQACVDVPAHGTATLSLPETIGVTPLRHRWRSNDRRGLAEINLRKDCLPGQTRREGTAAFASFPGVRLLLDHRVGLRV